jgi:hypothetical protein
VARERIVQQLPSTSGIEDPQIRAYLDNLNNAWSLRNGDIGSGEHRFITAKEFNSLAYDAITGFFAGGAGGGPGLGRPPGRIDEILEGIAQSVFRSQLFRDLGENIKRISAPWDTIDHIDGLVRGALQTIQIVKNGVTRLESVTASTITTVEAINLRLTNSEAQIVQLNTVSATSTSANALALFQLTARVGTTEASITELNTLETTSGSALASSFTQVRTSLGNVVRMYWQAEAPSGGSYNVGDQWFDTDNGDTAYYWNGSGWVAGSLQVYAYSDAGILTEATARVDKDTALAHAINHIWATMGGTSAVIQDGSFVSATAAQAAFASRWTTVQSAVYNFNTNTNYIAAVRQDLNTTNDLVNNKLQAAYTLRVEVGPNGRTTVGGFGIMGRFTDTEGPSIDFGVRADRFWITSTSSAAEDVNPFTVQTTSGPWGEPGVYMKSAMIQNATISSAMFENVIQSTNYWDGDSTNPAALGARGWRIDCRTGDAEFNNVYIRGTSRVGRLNVEGAITGTLTVRNNETATHTHNENRWVVVSVWSSNGSATLTGMTLNSFTVRVDFNTNDENLVHFRYF